MKFKVIGGQYKEIVYGLHNKLSEAMRTAEENTEYWDNWQGWHTPAIWEATDNGEEYTYLPQYKKAKEGYWMNIETGELISRKELEANENSRV